MKEKRFALRANSIHADSACTRSACTRLITLRMLALIFLALMGASGCSNANTDATPTNTNLSVTTDAESMPQRVISLSPSATEILYAIGAGDMVVAVDKYSDYPDEAPTSELDGWQPNIEAISEYEPDMVVLGVNNGDVISGLERLGIDVIVQVPPADIAELYDQFMELGDATDQTVAAAEVVSRMQREIAHIVDSAPDATGLRYYHELGSSLYTATSATFIGHVYSLFDMVNVADAADPDRLFGGSPQLNAEYVVNENPDLIFLAYTVCSDDAATCSGDAAQTLASRPGWETISAVANSNVFEIKNNVSSRWGPRVVDFVAAVANGLNELTG